VSSGGASSIFPPWPESEDQERELEQEIAAAFPFDDKSLTFAVGRSFPPSNPVRIRVMQELVGWISFEHTSGDLIASALLFDLWSVMAALRIRMWYAVPLTFVALQLINGRRLRRMDKTARSSSELLESLEGASPTWMMLMRALERFDISAYRIGAKWRVAGLMAAAAFAVLVIGRSWIFAIVSLIVFVLLAMVLAAMNIHLHRAACGVKISAGAHLGSGAARLDAALTALGAQLGRLYSPVAKRPRSDAFLHMPRRHLYPISAFDMEIGAVFVALVGYAVFRYRGDIAILGFHPFAGGLPTTPIVIVSGLLGFFVLRMHRLFRSRSTGFRTVVLRRFSLESDLIARRVLVPIFAACGKAQIVVPQALAAADERPDGALIGKGLRRSWLDVVIDEQINDFRRPGAPGKLGVFLIPRGAFARGETLAFGDEEWPRRVTELLNVCDAAAVDVTDFSPNVEFEVSAVLRALPQERIFFIARRGRFDELARFLEERGQRLSEFSNVIAYRRGYFGMTAFRWNLCRQVSRIR
jgi:hypothetical protein